MTDEEINEFTVSCNLTAEVLKRLRDALKAGVPVDSLPPDLRKALYELLAEYDAGLPLAVEFIRTYAPSLRQGPWTI